MRNLTRAIFALSLLSTLTGCAQVMMPGGQRQRVLFLQRGVIVQVVHTCTDHGRLYQAGGVVVDILGAEPRDIPMTPAIFGDDQISVTFQSLDASGKVVRTHSASFYVDQQSTTTQSMVISDQYSGWSGRGIRLNCKY